MAQWRDRVDSLLYAGETVERTVDLGDSGVVVTTHRVHVFTPAGDGPNYRSVERPNVEGAERTTRGQAGLLETAVKFGLVGGFLLAGSVVVDVGGLASDVDLGGTGATGLGGFMGTMQSLLDLLARLDEFLRLAGGVCLLGLVLVLGAYVATRRTLVVITVAGEDDVELPPADRATVDRLDRAVRGVPSQPPEAGP